MLESIEIIETVARRCSIKCVPLKFSQSSQKNTSLGVVTSEINGNIGTKLVTIKSHYSFHHLQLTETTKLATKFRH